MIKYYPEYEGYEIDGWMAEENFEIDGWEQYKERGWKQFQESTSELPELAKANVWVADIPEELGTFRTLYHHDNRLPRSRSQAYVVDDPHPSIKDPHREFKFAEGTMKKWSNFEDVELIVRRLHFTITILSLEGIDEEKQIARTDIHNYGSLQTILSERPQAIEEGEPTVWVENTL